MLKMNLQFFAEDGILGKKLIISIVDVEGKEIELKDRNGKLVSKSPEILKWNVEGIDNEEKKYPIGEDTEHRQVHYVGYQGSIEGQDINSWYSDVMDLIQEHYDKTGSTLQFTFTTTKTYKDGMVRKHKYTNVTFNKFSESADGNNKPLQNKFSWHAQKRIQIS
ncbi:hypothetical protein [Aneurinibacillus aneurinilyticus]|jgi:hypothetical protein|uniref:hypothetical protein n=1 Tax=Aneurinibacillus aneurinilyticus TaxID=1391 RepID=UPI0023F6F173|nr:hypothetical protein [Aneurinibacillus aneurinilyticus]MCI1696468.1 hypothetical protein [Aneurinibacillus aneurinilyticus]